MLVGPNSLRGVVLTASYEARLRAGEEPESFDKEYVRRWLAAEGFKGDGPIPPIPDEVRVEAQPHVGAAGASRDAVMNALTTARWSAVSRRKMS